LNTVLKLKFCNWQSNYDAANLLIFYLQ